MTFFDPQPHGLHGISLGVFSRAPGLLHPGRGFAGGRPAWRTMPGWALGFVSPHTPGGLFPLVFLANLEVTQQGTFSTKTDAMVQFNRDRAFLFQSAPLSVAFELVAGC